MELIKPITVTIDKDLWHQFKATVTRERTLNDAVVDLIRDAVDKGIARNETI